MISVCLGSCSKLASLGTLVDGADTTGDVASYHGPGKQPRLLKLPPGSSTCPFSSSVTGRSMDTLNCKEAETVKVQSYSGFGWRTEILGEPH